MSKINQTGKIGFGRAIADFFRGYFNFTGRTTRAGFWLASLFLAIIFLPTLFLFWVVEILLQGIPSLSWNPLAFNPFFYLILVMGLAVAFPILAMLARRLHDTAMRTYAIVLFLGLALLTRLVHIVLLEGMPAAVRFSLFLFSFFFVVAFFVFSLLPSNYFLDSGQGSAEDSDSDVSPVEPGLRDWSATAQGQVMKSEE